MTKRLAVKSYQGKMLASNQVIIYYELSVQVKQEYCAAQAQTNINTSEGMPLESTSYADPFLLYIRRLHDAQAFK